MSNILSSFTLRLALISFCGTIVPSETSDSLSRKNPGYAAQVLSNMADKQAASLLIPINPGIVAQFISPMVMYPTKVASILNQMPFGAAARILSPTVTMPDNAAIIKAEMVKQTPIELVRGFYQPGLMDPAGTHEGNVAQFLAHQVSADNAAKRLYSMKAATVARILAPTITDPTYAQAVWRSAATLHSSPASHHHSTYQDNSYGEGGEYGHGSHHGGQIAGVATGDALDDFRHSNDCQFNCTHWCSLSKDSDGAYLNPDDCFSYCRDYVCNQNNK